MLAMRPQFAGHEGGPSMTTSHRGLVLACILLAAGLADARVTKLTIANKVSPAYNGQIFGAAGQYETLAGTITGEVDPNDRRSAIIQDIGLAPRNARGMVEYTTTF